MKKEIIKYLNNQLSINQMNLKSIDKELISNKLMIQTIKQEYDYYSNLIIHLNNQLSIINSIEDDRFKKEISILIKDKLKITIFNQQTKESEMNYIQSLINNHPKKLQTIKHNINYYTNYISICNSDTSNFKDY
jgi:hypothetical protein